MWDRCRSQETQEIAGLSSSSRSQVEADIDEFYDWLWSFEPYTAAFGMGGVGQEGEYRTQSIWNDPMRPLQRRLPYDYERLYQRIEGCFRSIRT